MADTIDHVIPRSKGGEHSWENVVAACRACNTFKDDRTLEQLGWSLNFTPFAPKGLQWVTIGIAKFDEAWAPYLGEMAIA